MMWNKIKSIFSTSRKDEDDSERVSTETSFSVEGASTEEDCFSCIDNSETIAISELQNNSSGAINPHFNKPIADALYKIKQLYGINFILSDKIVNALADFNAFKGNRASQVIFKTLCNENVFSTFANVNAIGNLYNEVSKYASNISNQYGYKEDIVLNVVLEVLLGTEIISIDDITKFKVSQTNINEGNNITVTTSKETIIEIASREYVLPPLDLFQESNISIPSVEELAATKSRLEWILSRYGIKDLVITPIPSYRVSMFEIEVLPQYVGKIARNEKDILMALGSNGCRLVNPIPGKLAIGIEIPNHNYTMSTGLRLLIDSLETTKGTPYLRIPIGLDSSNNIITLDLDKESSILICGDTQQGKTELLKQIPVILMARNTPSDVKFIFATSNPIELSEFNKINPSFLAKPESIRETVVSKSDDVLTIAKALINEKDIRTKLLYKAGVSTINEYNSLFQKGLLNPSERHHYLPHIIMLVDEYAPIFNGKSWDDQLHKLFEKIKGIGIHFIVTTKLTTASNLTPLIRRYFENRICYRIQMQNESRLAVNSTLATTLLQYGDVLIYSNGNIARCQTMLCDPGCIKDMILHTNKFTIQTPYIIPDDIDQNDYLYGDFNSGIDPLFEEAARTVVMSNTASVSSLQRRYSIGYHRAGKIMDQLESAGIVGAATGGKPRPVLTDPVGLEAILEQYIIGQ